MRRFALSLVVLVAPLLWLGAEPASACSCVTREMPELVSSAEVVTTGELLGRDDQSQTILYSFRSEVQHKGTVPAVFEVRVGAESAACGMPNLVVGRRYVLFMETGGGELRTNICSGTGAATPAYVREVAEVTGKGTPSVATALLVLKSLAWWG